MSRISLCIRVVLAASAALLPCLAFAQTPEAAAPAENGGIRGAETGAVSLTARPPAIRN